MSHLDRRKFIKLSATAGLAGTLWPPLVQKALAVEAHNTTRSIRDVEHIVILMQENRSFDHYFGTLKGVRGFGDRFTIPLINNRKVWQQERGNGALLTPYHLDSTANNAQRVSGTNHTWVDSQEAWDNGRMTQLPRYKQDQSKGYYKEPEVPIQFALANAFTLCDAYHCSMHTGTDANRSFHLTGTNGPTAQNVAYVNNEWDWIAGTSGNDETGYTWKTYAENLEDAGVSWICYQNMP